MGLKSLDITILHISILHISIFDISIFHFGDCKILNAVENEISPVDLPVYTLFVPGTKWCGPGNKAENYDDLGAAEGTDKCCRAHDNCGEVIKAGETKYNLTNDSSYSRLSCRCDEEFRLCLRNEHSGTSGVVGTGYFNVIGTQCFKKDYKAIGCKKYSGWTNSKCIEYEYDMSSEQHYQWFDVPNFYESDDDAENRFVYYEGL